MDSRDKVEQAYGLQGKYRIEQVLAEGGQGTVVRAVQIDLDRPVAIKFLRKDLLVHEKAEERFLAEARLAARIAHPNVVQVLAWGVGPQGMYVVYELVEGESLRGRIGDGMPPGRAVSTAVQVCLALSAVHEAGVVHRDLKPENLLVERGGQVKLTDLGIARDLSRGLRTETGVIFGTPQYMSPEQCRGDPVGPASDLYSLGVVLFEMLTGTIPFDGAIPDVIDGHLQRMPPRPSSTGLHLPPEWDRVVGWTLAKSPQDRPASAEELAAALESLPALSETKVAAASLGRGAPTAMLRRSGDATARRAVPAGPGPSGTRALSSPIRDVQDPGRNIRFLAAIAVIAAIVAATAWMVNPAGEVDPRARIAGAVSADRPDFEPGGGPESTRPFRELPWPEQVDLLVERTSGQIARELSFTGQVARRQDVTPGREGDAVFDVDVLVVGAGELLGPRIEMMAPIARASAEGPLPPPRVSLREIGTGRMAALPVEVRGDSAWSVPVTTGLIRDGAGCFRIELPEGYVGASVPMVALAFERPPGFPRVSRKEGAPPHPPGCEAVAETLAQNGSLASVSPLGDTEHRARELVRAAPGCVDAHIHLGEILFKIWAERKTTGDGVETMWGAALTGQLDLTIPLQEVRHEALEQLSWVVRTYPEWPRGWEALAHISKDSAEWPAALRASRWSVLRHPDHPGVWMSFAATTAMWLAAARDRLDPEELKREARACLETMEAASVASNRSHDPALIYLKARAMLLEQSGELARAADVYEELLKKNPGYREAERELEAVRDRLAAERR